MGRKRKEPSPEVIHDLTGLIEYKIIELIYDGTKRKRASLYLVAVRKSVEAARARNVRQRRIDTTSAPAPSRELYVLKIFPRSRANELDYEADLAANIELSRKWAAVSAEAACDALLRSPEKPGTNRWPRCYGTMTVQANPGADQWLAGQSGPPACHSILFEHFPGLELLKKEKITEDIVSEFKRLLADLHGLKILHRDHITHTIWPEIGFNNVFLRDNDITGKKDLVILDFDKSKVLKGSPSDQVLFAAELERIGEVLDQALSGEAVAGSTSKEVQRLLADRLI